MKNKKYLLSLLIIPIIVLFVGRSLAANFDHEVKSVEITSNDYNNPGSWHVDKSADWISSDTAEVTFNISSIKKRTDYRNKDVIFVIDVSGSMSSDQISQIKTDTKKLVDFLLDESDNNRFAIVNFESGSSILSFFTNSRSTLKSKLDNITRFDQTNYHPSLVTNNVLLALGGTNYNSGLLEVERVMENYQPVENKDVVVLFLSDGYPNEDIPNERVTYRRLKEKYPYLSIQGIQYTGGTRVFDEIVNISDKQWIADVTNLEDILYDATIVPGEYEEFSVRDYVANDYFDLQSVDDIKVESGTVSLNEENGVQKITWTLDNSLIGFSSKMTIKLKLKNEFLNVGGFYPTNKKEIISSKIANEDKITINSTNIPVLSRKYNVTYDLNKPEGCDISEFTQESYFPYDTVTRKSISLRCEGYNFRGWEFDEEDDTDIEHINDDVFTMPSHDVTIHAIWDKLTLVKSMDGEVKVNANTLFDIMKVSAVPDDRPSQYVTSENGINFKERASDTNGKGVYELRSSNATSDGTNIPIYYYRGKVDNNYVVFGGYCWQMIRSTPDKGVKLSYSGAAEGDNKDLCTGPRSGYISADKSWSPQVSSTYENYVIVSRFSFGGYMSDEKIYERVPFGHKITTSTHIYTFYRMTFYDSNYVEKNPSYRYDYYFADSYDYDEATGKYHLINPILYDFSNNDSYYGKYTLMSSNPDESSSTLYYYHSGEFHHYSSSYSSFTYDYINTEFLPMTDNHPLSFYKNLSYGTGFTQNNDGTYSLTGVITKDITDYSTNYSSYNGLYYCYGTITCENPIYIYNPTSSYYYYNSAAKKYKIATSVNGFDLVDPIEVYEKDITNSSYSSYIYFCSDGQDHCNANTLKKITSRNSTYFEYNDYFQFGSTFTYDGEYYNIVNPVSYFDSTSNIVSCLNNEETRCKEVLIRIGVVSYYITSESEFAFIKLSNGELNPIEVFDRRKNVEVDENKNPINKSKNSALKEIMDAWYERSLIDYAKYLDDAVWCNDRITRDEDYADSFIDFNYQTGTLGTKNLVYNSAYRLFGQYPYYNDPTYGKPSLKCEDKRDAFTVNDTINGNGWLKYPIASLTGDEYLLTGLDTGDSFINNSFWYTMTPVYAYSTNEAYLFQSGGLWTYAGVARDMKPAIVLKPNIKVKSGDGTAENPYQLDLQ